MDIYLIGSGFVSPDQIASIPFGAHIAAFNNGYKATPHADFLFFQDAHFYELHKDGLEKFKGRVLSILPTESEKIELLTAADITVKKGKKTFSAMGKNSGFHAICWALNNGYNHVYLLGFDCKYTWGSMTMPEVFAMWQEQHKELASLKLPITNLTPDSGIDGIY